MGGVLVGFAIIGTIIAVGYVVARTQILGDDPRRALSRLVFFVLSPCLLFTVLADADVHTLFSRLLAVSAISAVFSCLVFAAVAFFIFRRSVADTTVGAASS